MQLRRVGVLGGGPGGLYAARLLKLARPSCDVIVYEQGEPGSTFGFGVGLAASAGHLFASDPGNATVYELNSDGSTVQNTFVQPMNTLCVSAPVFCCPANFRIVGP